MVLWSGQERRDRRLAGHRPRRRSDRRVTARRPNPGSCPWKAISVGRNVDCPERPSRSRPAGLGAGGEAHRTVPEGDARCLASPRVAGGGGLGPRPSGRSGANLAGPTTRPPPAASSSAGSPAWPKSGRTGTRPSIGWPSREKLDGDTVETTPGANGTLGRRYGKERRPPARLGGEHRHVHRFAALRLWSGLLKAATQGTTPRRSNGFAGGLSRRNPSMHKSASNFSNRPFAAGDAAAMDQALADLERCAAQSATGCAGRPGARPGRPCRPRTAAPPTPRSTRP